MEFGRGKASFPLHKHLDLKNRVWRGVPQQYEITWSQNGNMRSVKELSDHLRRIVREEKNMEIPDKPPANVPERR